jgi:hypothetical protein
VATGPCRFIFVGRIIPSLDTCKRLAFAPRLVGFDRIWTIISKVALLPHTKHHLFLCLFLSMLKRRSSTCRGTPIRLILWIILISFLMHQTVSSSSKNDVEAWSSLSSSSSSLEELELGAFFCKKKTYDFEEVGSSSWPSCVIFKMPQSSRSWVSRSFGSNLPSCEEWW